MNEIDKAIEILQAFKEGKTIEYRTRDGKWYEETVGINILHNLGDRVVLRIK